MIRVVGPRRLPTASETNVRRQNGKTPNSSTRGSVASTEASCPPTFLFGVETVITNQTIHSDDGQQPAATFHFAMAATSRHAHAKHVTRTPATAPPRWSSSTASCATSDGKRQKTAPAREDPCCPCLILSHALSAIARAPRHGGPAKIATQAVGDAPIRLPPTTQSSAMPIATITRDPHRQDFAPAWASRHAL